MRASVITPLDVGKACAMTAFLSVMFVYSVCGFVDSVDSMPDVFKEWPTGRCVAVIYPDGRRGDCKNLPAKYFTHWVSEQNERIMPNVRNI